MQRREAKYKKRCQRLRLKLTSDGSNCSPRTKTWNNVQKHRVPANIRKTLLFHNTLLHQIKKKYKSLSYKEKNALRRAVSDRLLRKYKLVNLLKKTVGIGHRELNKTLDKPQSRFTYQRSSNKKTMEIVKMFLSRDDNSRASAGKNETITRFKKKKQKRFLSDTMLNLHQKLMLEMPHLKLSYSLFCRKIPFWIVAPNINNRETCVCKLHDNRRVHTGVLFPQ